MRGAWCVVRGACQACGWLRRRRRRWGWGSRANSSSMAAWPSKRTCWRRPASEATASKRRPTLEVSGELRRRASIVRSRPSSAGEKAWHRRQLGHRESGLAEHFVEQAQGGPARLFHGCVAAGQAELAKMGHALTGGFRNEKEFAAPNRAVEAVAGAVPGDAEDRRRQLILGHAGQDVGDVMLDADELRWGRARCPQRAASLRPGRRAGDSAPYLLAGELGGEVIGMRVGGDNRGASFIERLKVGNDPAKGLAGLVGFQVADVLADEDLGPHRERDSVL